MIRPVDNIVGGIGGPPTSHDPLREAREAAQDRLDAAVAAYTRTPEGINSLIDRDPVQSAIHALLTELLIGEPPLRATVDNALLGLRQVALREAVLLAAEEQKGE